MLQLSHQAAICPNHMFTSQNWWTSFSVITNLARLSDQINLLQETAWGLYHFLLIRLRITRDDGGQMSIGDQGGARHFELWPPDSWPWPPQWRGRSTDQLLRSGQDWEENWVPVKSVTHCGASVSSWYTGDLDLLSSRFHTCVPSSERTFGQKHSSVRSTGFSMVSSHSQVN